jgi:peptidoglycan/xylan/chitin deacetylase (PgdA/CDA1 family)
MSLLAVKRDYVLRALHLLTGAGRDTHLIVLYHSVGEDAPHSVPLEDFKAQMELLAERFRIVQLRDLRQARQTEAGLGNIAVVTFDDGYLNNFSKAAPVMEGLGIKGTFFITTGRMGRQFQTYRGEVPMMGAGEVRELARRGHEIGAHTVSHPKLTRIGLAEAQSEIVDSKLALEDELGESLHSFAYPKGDWSPQVRSLVEGAGFEAAVTIEERPVGGNPDWLALPRLCIGAGMKMAAFRAAVSPALGVYARARKR